MIESGFDPSVINDLIDLGPDTGVQLVKDLIELFYAEAPMRVDAMRSGIRGQNPDGIAYAAHAMRGGAGNLGAIRIASLCTELEAAAKSGDLSAAPALVDQIELELERVGAALQRRVASLQPGD
jgi:HPt (histidine-containing phosphotransfer) domain-containing protein